MTPLIQPLFLVLQKLFFILCGVFGIGFVIGFHELGHFLFCKLFDIRTPSFSIGFGPRIFEKKIGETTFALSAIPLGGYVEIAGSAEVGQGSQEEAYSVDERSFANKPFYQKLAVMGGGIAFNLIFAYFIFFLLFKVGLPATPYLYPSNATTEITEVAPESSAQKAGLVQGDKIIAINQIQTMNNGEKLFKTLEPLALKEVSIEFERNNTLLTTTATLGKHELLGYGSLGIALKMIEKPGLPFIQAIKQGFSRVNAFISTTIQALVAMFKTRKAFGVAGPIMIMSETTKSAGHGLWSFLIFLAIISINLAIFNLLPLPILDGGQALFVIIESIIGRPLPEKIKEIIHISCWILMLILVIYLSAKDILRIANPYLASITRFFGIGK